MAPSTIVRVKALCSWLQAGGIVSSESELNSWRKECKALASLLYLEDKLLEDMCTSIHQVTSPGRLLAMLSLLTGSILSPDAAAKLPYDAMSNIHSKAVVWICSFLDIDPEHGGPSSSQLAVAEVLLRAKVLQGCSRLLASATAPVAASGEGTQCVWRQSLARKGDEEARALDFALSTANCLLPPLATVCGMLQSTSTAPSTGQRASSSTTPGRDGSERQARAIELGDEVQRGEKGQEDGLQGQGAHPGGVAHVAQPAGLLQQLVAALDDSCVLEHFARGVLVQAGYLQRTQQAGRHHSQAHAQLYNGLSSFCASFAMLYSDLLNLQAGAGLPGAGSSRSAARPQQGGEGAPARALGDAAAPPTSQHGASRTPALEASGDDLDAAHVPLLGRVLSGPCARHLVLCQGLRALCALDGGGDYGLPVEAGLHSLPLCKGGHEDEDQEELSQRVRLAVGPFQNLVAMLSMHRGDQGGEEEAQLPGRGTRLQLTLRVVHSAAGAKAGGSGGGSGGSPRHVLDQAEAGFVAVYSLHKAWRHMPPPCAPARANHRRAALRRWAAAAEQVARSGAATGARSYPLCGRNLACMLRLHPSYVGAVERQDLPALASGGHLLRALEGLVGQAARDVGDQAGPPCRCTPAAGAGLRTPIGWALRSFVQELSCGVWPCPLRDLLLQPGEDEQPGAGQGQCGATGQVGWSGGGLRAAASLAVALGKLLRRCEGAVAESLAKCGDSMADKDFGETGRDTALEIMWAVCGVLLASPECTAAAQLGARTGAEAREEGAAPVPEGGGQLGWGWVARRRVRVCAYGAWRWLPPLASMARRAAAAGHINSASLQAWLACLVWVGRLCLACCTESRVAGLGLEARDGEGESVGSGTAGMSGGGGAQTALAAAAGGGGSCCSCADCAGCGAHSGGWREFLLRDVGVVGLLGAALNGLVPALLAGDGDEESQSLLKATAEACVLAAAAFPTEVAQYAWGAHDGGADGASGGSGAMWSTKVLAELTMRVGGAQGGQPLAGALRALEEWGGECEVAGRPVGPSAQQEQLLDQAGAAMLHDSEWLEQNAVFLLPPLCEVRAMLRVCSNPRCVALPPPGQTEAEAKAEAGAGRGACVGASSAAWYCCAECREQHSKAGAGAGAGATGVKQRPCDGQESLEQALMKS